MARVAWKGTLGTPIAGGGRTSVSTGRTTDTSIKTASAVALQAALDAAQAAAVAKTTNDASVEIAAVGVALTAYETAVNLADTQALSGDITVSINTTNITSINQLKSAFAAILLQAQGDAILTA